MRTLFLALFCLTAPALALAQTAITGVVRAETGAVVSGASIMVRTDNGLDQRAVTGWTTLRVAHSMRRGDRRVGKAPLCPRDA